MTRVPTIDRITDVFARLESYLKLKGRQNLNDAAVLAEDFCKHLLNRLYGHRTVIFFATVERGGCGEKHFGLDKSVVFE